MADPCINSAKDHAKELEGITKYAYDVWTYRHKPETSYLTQFQRLKKWPEPSHLQIDHDIHYRHRPQPSFHFMHTRQFPLPSQLGAEVKGVKRMPTLGGGINGRHPVDCHVSSAARALTSLQWQRSQDDFKVTAALAAELAEIPNVDVRRTDSFTHADMHKIHPKRGDFSIHPDWPPTLHHHRIPYLQE